MKESPQEWHYTSVGFWLPCYQSSFFSHTQTDSDRDVLKQTGYDFKEGHYDSFKDTENLRLETSIYRRLLMVLPNLGYTAAYPLFASKRHGHFRDLADPNAVLYVCMKPNVLPGLAGMPINALTLLVQQDGYYMWTAEYDIAQAHEYQIQDAMRQHIYAIVGGPFCSRYSGRQSQQEGEKEKADRETLKQYRDKRLGMLTFFQLNIILEGMYNSNLDFRAFFKSEQSVASEYSVGDFVLQIVANYRPPQHIKKAHDSKAVAPTDVGGDSRHQGDQKLEHISALFHEASQATVAISEETLRNFQAAVSNSTFRGHILDTFLTVTEVISLKPMKMRIERCRRGLLEDLIEVTHRREPLVQAEPPDDLVDRIDDVTEAQLRGYVMLFAAKMPLISNVLLHLEDLHYSKAGPHHSNQPDDVEAVSSEAYAPFQSWKTLLQALLHDVEGLSDAIDQSQADRMLYEEEQIHAEQETLAEIQRIRERTDSALSPAHNLAINVIANLLAFFAVILAAAALANQGIIQLHISFGDFLSIFGPKNWPEDTELLKILVVLIVGYLGIHYAFQILIRSLIRLIKRDLRLDAQYYYELDVHIDAPFHMSVLDALFETGIPGASSTVAVTPNTPSRLARFLSLVWRIVSFPVRAPKKAAIGLRNWWKPNPFRRVKRNSYRAERLEKAEALHKIYIEAEIRVGPSKPNLGPGRYVPAILVYELMYHRPAQEHGYIFKDIHVVSTHARILNKAEIVAFKHTIAQHFIDPCLQPGWRLINAAHGGQNADGAAMLDAFFTITETVK